jgi:hypothetical protein
VAVAWPRLDELKQVLDVTGTDWDGDGAGYDDDTRLARLLQAAIDKVKEDVGNWDDAVDEADSRLAQAALRMAELMALRPELSVQTEKDPTYLRLLKGHRRTFGISSGGFTTTT